MPIGTRSRSRAGRGRQAVGGVVGVDVAEAEQLHVVGRGRGDVDGGARRGRLGAGGLQRRHPAGEGLGRGEVALVGEGLDRLVAQPQREHGPLVQLVGALDELQAQPGGVLELVPAARQVEQGDAVQAVGRDDVVARRQVAAVDHEQDVRGRRPARRHRSGDGR